MSFSSKSTVGQSAGQWDLSGQYSTEKRGRWTGLNIAAMVVGFVFFWPLGLVILYWILTDRDVRDLPAAMREKWTQLRGGRTMHSDNVVFNKYQQTQYDRIQEIKDEMNARAKRFAEFRADVRRRADEEEFNRFMASSPGQGSD